MRRAAKKISPIAVTLRASFFVVVASIILCGCVKPNKQKSESTSQPQASQPPAASAGESKPEKEIVAAPPHPVAIQAAIMRVFEGTVTLDQNRFLVGDFDKDGSQDLVAVVRPVKEKLPVINDEFARWKLEDPRKVFFLKSVKDLQRGLPSSPPDPVLAAPNDLLLAVVHGHGPYGWRNTEAMNAYLLKNAVGSQMTMEPLEGARAATRGKRGLVTLRGDVIKQTLGGETGYIFWTGAAYGWHSLKERKATEHQSVAQLTSPGKGAQ